jgi:putative transcriptional regulator
MSELKHYRKKLNQTQKEVAANLGISLSAYSQAEQGRKGVSDKLKIKMAKYFNTTVGVLFFGEGITISNRNDKTKNIKQTNY